MKTIDITTYRINRLLREKAWSQSMLAQKLGVTQQTIQKWVKGKASPSMENIDRLVDVTGYPSHWFMLPPEDDDQQSAPLPAKMSETERELLLIFGAFPEDDQRQMLQEMKDKKESMDKTVERWLAAQKGRRA
ncbi:helix-turn-helix domain-containing protein [Pluralibacter gergoviae]|nr:helix-turn-helix domain-containing protein [Pluralibacter gergoviae]ELC3015624.1 helix-turn-helix domain-containing protein [Pluralibacter gergoviae]ELC3020603.1 helix-turn-helix domain-containing protein [Pluralibacter gergoviae]